ncbi:MAG TPA: hypothetical protein VJ255_20930 [Candidatus Acidoferrum sp.]|nr:hypothetical protein [Candidatus Acidoferrum sp.]
MGGEAATPWTWRLAFCSLSVLMETWVLPVLPGAWFAPRCPDLPSQFSALRTLFPCYKLFPWGLGNGRAVAIHRLLQNVALGPEEIDRLSKAYEQALRTIGVKERGDPLTELIAKKIIEIGKTGLKDPAKISAQAIKELRLQ